MMNFKIVLLFVFTLIIFFSLKPHAMTTQGSQIISTDGKPIELKGVNWFGFNNQQTMVDGLWNSSASLSYDYATVVQRMKALGFNAVRLPFSFKDLYETPPKNYTSSCSLASFDQIQANVTNPGVPVPDGKKMPLLPSPPERQNGSCNSYLPNDSTLNRFVWTVRFFAKNGFYVLIDNHLREDGTAVEDQKKWLQDWSQLITLLSDDPDIKGKLMVDILNEPDDHGIRWEASGDKPGLKDLYLSAMDELYPINNDLLFFIEGTGQSGLDANWGDGFASDPQLISQHGLSDPNPFFKALLNKPYANQVVISPHIYPPTVTNASKNYSGAGLWNRLSNSFGYLTQEGYCSSEGSCKTFPVALGEFGSRFTDARDLTSMADLARYLNNIDGGADGRHSSIPNWFYWSWNANSGDTGGIVGDNWVDIQWKKIDYLATVGLKPWYASDEKTPMGTLCLQITPAEGLTNNALKALNVGGVVFDIKELGVTLCQQVPAGNYSITAPKISLPGFEFEAAPISTQVLENSTSSAEILYKGSTVEQPAKGTFSVKVENGGSWSDSSGTYSSVVNLYIKNMGDTPVDVPWKVSVSNNDYTGLASSWNMQSAEFKDGTITAVVESEWATLQPKGGNAINIGMVIQSKSDNFAPSAITINGLSATIEK